MLSYVEAPSDRRSTMVASPTLQVEAEAAGRWDALRRAAAALQEAEAKARLAVTLRAELDELVDAAAHLEAELVAAQARTMDRMSLGFACVWRTLSLSRIRGQGCTGPRWQAG